MAKEVYIGIDIGGTNIRPYGVDPNTGRIPELEGKKSRDIKSAGITSNDELTDVVRKELSKITSDMVNIGISAAGDIDEENLVIKFSPNLRIKGPITLAADLKADGYDVVITNDMRAAHAGTVMFGDGKGFKNVLVATYSSGFNCSTGESHAEFGHMPYRPRVVGVFERLKCGCGGYNHLEPCVSGNGAVLMAIERFEKGDSLDDIFKAAIGDKPKAERKSFRQKLERIKPKTSEKLRELITARDIYDAYRENPKGVQEAIRKLQVYSIADSFGMMVSAFNPVERIVLMGSQTKDWDIVFEPAIKLYSGDIKNYQLSSLNVPGIVRNSVRKLGVVGGVAYFLQSRGRIEA